MRSVTLAGLAIGVLGLVLWLTGGFASLQVWAELAGRAVQRDLAGAVRAIASGNPGAVAGLLGLCFAYGFLHAAGPGHGKMLIGAFGVARRVPMARLVVLALLSSLAQATVAVAVVYALVLGAGWARTKVEGVAETVFLPFSHAMIAAIGLWLVWRGWQGLRRQTAPQPQAHHDHHHHEHDEDCGCGHAHAPSLDQVAAVTGWRDAAALIAAVALRPCSGALFLLVVSWQMGIAAAGVAGAYAMGLGTALVTIAVAVMAVWSREGALSLVPAQLARAVPLIEFCVGALIALVAGQMLLAAL
ncbi:nickel/cobalt transporter [Gemmobacter denitrificans]|uniref:Nickel/cobalt efflux system n=1 Tax=Gemmobacter denitrificans TaxID=3123040 RepID=A0ABU8BSD0_9RHOB